MEEIEGLLETLKEDKPELIITDNIIRCYIEDNMKLLIKEIKEDLCI